MSTGAPNYKFGDFELNQQAFHVTRAGAPVPLEPKAIRVLVYLIENRQRTVSKDELLQAVWENAIVGENALTRVIAQLRKALGDDARQARYIETVPTVGYRFLAEIVGSTPLPAAPPKQRRLWLYALPVAIVLAAAAILAAWRAPHGVRPVVGALQTRQITSSESYDIAPGFSPDGRSLTYASNRSGSFEIYVRPLTFGGREIAITSDGQQNIHPAWSPDGRFIAYESLKKGGIFRVPATGGLPAPVASPGARPAWSPDSKWIVYQTQATMSLMVSDVSSADSFIAIVPAEGGKPRIITYTEHPPGRHTWPRFSPDGRRILLLAHTPPSLPQLWSIKADGSDPQQVRGSPTRLTAFDWARDGRGIMVACFSDGVFTISRAPWEGSAFAALGAPVEITRTGGNVVSYLSLSADGKQLAYSAALQTSNLWSLPMDPATSRPAGPPRALTHDTSLRNALPAISPDGAHLAWWVLRGGSPPRVWVADIDGGNARPFRDSPRGDDDPQWIDNRTLAFLGYLQDTSHVAVWEGGFPDGPARKVVELEPGADRITLSPGGREVAYHRQLNGVLNIWKRRIPGPSVQLTFDKESLGYPIWSPDGKWLAAEMSRGADVHIALVPVEGGPIRQLTKEAGQEFVYTWTADSSKIAFAAYRGGAWNLYWVEVSTARITQLTDYDSPAGFVRYPAWAARGDKILFEKAAMQGNIFLTDLASH